jgi:hypothetical protein
MKKYAPALLVIFIILLSTQFISHAYVSIFHSRTSVLDKYEGKKTDFTMDKSLSLKELSMIYADAEKRIRVFEKGKSQKELALYDKSDEPYSRKYKVEEIITSRESDYRMIIGIVFFWVTGLLLIAGGSFVYMKYEPHTGAALVIAGFTQMTWITGPLFFMTAPGPESSLILVVKLVCTAITLAGLIAYWIYTRDYIDR